MKTFFASKNINIVRQHLRASGAKYIGIGGWFRRDGSPTGIYWDSEIAKWYTFI